MNSVDIIGRLTKDVDYRVAGSKQTPIARYTLAVDRGQDQADFIPCVCFNKTADFAQKYLQKGSKVGVHGSLMSGKYTDQSGRDVFTLDVNVYEHTFCESRQQNAQQAQPQRAQASAGGFMGLPEGLDDELPFK